MMLPLSRRSRALRADLLILGFVLGALSCERGSPPPAEPKPPIAATTSASPPEAGLADDATSTPQSIQPPLGNAADSARARNAKYPSDEEAAVYRAVLSGFAAPPPAGKITLLYGTTKSQCQGPACADDYYRRIRFEPEIMLSTMENFLWVREKRLDLRHGFTGIPNAVLLGDSTLKLLEQAMGRSDLISNWSLIRLAYPAVERIVQLSPVAFSPHHKQAMVELARGDINGMARELWIAEKQSDGDWRIVRWFREATRTPDK
jgi:hypothetical protein